MYIYLSIYLSICLYSINVKTEWAQILCGTSRNPRECLQIINISKIYIYIKY